MADPEHLAILKQGIEASKTCWKSEFMSIHIDIIVIRKGG